MSLPGQETPPTEELKPETEFFAPEHSKEPAMCFCPICSRRLLSERCKLVCQQCGYFMSCADYY